MHLKSGLWKGGNTMNLILRPGTPEDVDICGAIFYEAFKSIAEQHNFPPDVTPPEGGTASGWSRRFSHPNNYVVVAELDGRIAGSNFVDERDITTNTYIY
jgi:hypothetical protein